jgi:hypothetical protein
MLPGTHTEQQCCWTSYRKNTNSQADFQMNVLALMYWKCTLCQDIEVGQFAYDE